MKKLALIASIALLFLAIGWIGFAGAQMVNVDTNTIPCYKSVPVNSNLQYMVQDVILSSETFAYTLDTGTTQMVQENYTIYGSSKIYNRTVNLLYFQKIPYPMTWSPVMNSNLDMGTRSDGFVGYRIRPLP